MRWEKNINIYSLCQTNAIIILKGPVKVMGHKFKLVLGSKRPLQIAIVSPSVR